jgi:putative aldouronate transport system permease protein
MNVRFLYLYALLEGTVMAVKKKRPFLDELSRNRVLFLMLIPAAAFFIINNYIPMIGIYYAFTRFNFRGGLFRSPFIGLQNFRFLVQSGKLFLLTVNTIGYNIAFILVSNVLQIFFAIVLSRLIGVVFKRVTQSLIFLPYFVSYVILNAIVFSVFNYETGYLNTILSSLGMARVNVYSIPWIWRILMVIFYVWKSLGYGTVIYLAAIMGISQEFYEAAKIDGAGVMQQIIRITIPMLAPTFIILLLFALGGIMRGHFDLFYQVIGNNGILYDTTDILDTYVYRSLKQDFDVGMGTAAGIYQSAIGFAIIMTTNWLIKRSQSDYVLF